MTPLRIGVVTHYMPPHQGGIERVAESLFQAYRQEGWEVRWLASDDPAKAGEEGGRVRVPTWNVLERRLGVPIPVWGPAAWRRLSELVRWADVVHVHDCLYPGSYFAVRWSRRRGVPVFLTQHIGFVEYGLRLLNGIESVAYRTLGRRTLRGVDRIVLATPSAETWLADLLPAGPAVPPRQKIYNGIDLERFRPPTPEERRAEREHLGLDPGGGPVVLFVGRLVEKKGIPVVVETVRRCPEVRFVLVGDGPLDGMVRELVTELGSAVVHRPSVAPEEMQRLYWAADAFFLPSYGEGLPLVVQEAMACGLPALVSEDEPFSREVVAAADGGCLSAERTAEAMAAALPALFAEERSVAARRHAEAHWGFAAMAGFYGDIVRGLTGDGRGRRHG
ncbi:MAG: glycosyltransferase family 4 protein [Acidobacteriota bacterium]